MNILVTNFNDTGEDVCILNTSLTVEQLQEALEKREQQFDDVHEVKDDELQYYVYDPLIATPQFEAGVREITGSHEKD